MTNAEVTSELVSFVSDGASDGDPRTERVCT